MSAFSDRAYDYFLGQGYSPSGAAALAGNAEHESSGNTRAVHDGGTGLGIFGWRDPEPGRGRKTALINWAAKEGLDPYSEATQFAFAKHELETSKQGIGETLKTAPDLKTAHDAVMGYLAPRDYTPDNPSAGHGYARRFNLAAAYTGDDPMSVPIGAGPGGNGTIPQGPLNTATPGGSGVPYPTAAPVDTGLLSDKVQALLAATAQEKKARDNDDLMKQGSGLLGQSMQAAPQTAMQPVPIHRPEMPQGGAGMDYAQLLMQQRLARRT